MPAAATAAVDVKTKVRKWLEDNSCNDLFSYSSSLASDSLVVLTDDDDKTEEGDRPAVIVVSSGGSSGSDDDDGSDSCIKMVRRIDGIANRAESMYNEQQFNLAVEKAAVQYACAEMARIMNLDSESDMPSDSTILHVVSWLSIEVNLTCNSMQWRHQVKDKVREVLIEQYGSHAQYSAYLY